MGLWPLSGLFQMMVCVKDRLDRDEYTVEYAQRRTERCAVCDLTYPPSEIVTRAGEQLCQSCDLNKYLIRDEDIPY